MKKLLLLVPVVLFSYSINAQTEKGSLLVGASSNFSTSSFSTDQVNINLSGQGGYFVAENFAAGFVVGFSRSSRNEFSSVFTEIGPFARYYIKGTFYLGAGFNRVSGNAKNGSNVTSEFTGGELTMELGYPIWIVENVAIEPGLNYAVRSSGLSGSSFDLGVSFMLYF